MKRYKTTPGSPSEEEEARNPSPKRENTRPNRNERTRGPPRYDKTLPVVLAGAATAGQRNNQKRAAPARNTDTKRGRESQIQRPLPDPSSAFTENSHLLRPSAGPSLDPTSTGCYYNGDGALGISGMRLHSARQVNQAHQGRELQFRNCVSFIPSPGRRAPSNFCMGISLQYGLYHTVRVGAGDWG
ncbi:unnamed protein product [Calypogeia fissa]